MFKKTTGIMALALLAGCSVSGGPAEVLPYKTPVDEDSGIRWVNQGNIIGDYEHRTSVKPGEWRKLNDEQSPARENGS